MTCFTQSILIYAGYIFFYRPLESDETEIINGFVTMLSLIYGLCLVLAYTYQHCT